MAIYKEDFVNIDLNNGNIFRSFLTKTIGEGDILADRFGVHVFRNGEEVDMAGSTCNGYFIRSDRATVPITGVVNGARAYVDLPSVCYEIEGHFTLAIKVIGTGITGTMRIVDGMVDNTNTSGAVAPTSSVPTYSEIIAQYDDAVTYRYENDEKLGTLYIFCTADALADAGITAGS